MKQITELTEIEILALTDEQLSNMVKYKMAEDGIKILDVPIEPTYAPMPAKEVQVFKVKGIDNYFWSNADAEKVGQLLKQLKGNMCSTAYPNYDYSLAWAEKESETNYSFSKYGDVEPTMIYEKHVVLGIADLVERNKVAKKAYEAELKEYKDAENASSDIKSLIYGTYHEMAKKYAKMDDMKYQYEKYVKLADGHALTAMRFLKNAYTIDEKTECYVKGIPYNPVLDEEAVTAE